MPLKVTPVKRTGRGVPAKAETEDADGAIVDERHTEERGGGGCVMTGGEGRQRKVQEKQRRSRGDGRRAVVC